MTGLRPLGARKSAVTAESKSATIFAKNADVENVRAVRHTLIRRPGAERGLRQVLEQEGLEDLRAATERRQDVQQPPPSLAALATNTRTYTHAHGAF